MPEHESITVETHGGRWVEARELKVGDVLMLRDGSPVKIVQREITQRAAWVYNLWVDGVHSYAVGFSGLLVHNSSEACAEIVQLTARGVNTWKKVGGNGNEYADWVVKKIGASLETTIQGAVPGATGKLTKLTEFGGTTTADFDGFLGKVWLECKVDVTNMSSLASTMAQLGREVKVANSYGAKVRLITATSLTNVPAELVAFCKKKGIDLVSFGGSH